MSEIRARILVFCTSASVLVLEILAGRLMAPYVGVSLETFTAIIGVILAGIALGSAVGGRLADRYDPKTLIGPALAAGGALAWWSLWLVSVLGPQLGAEPPAIVLLATLTFFAPAAVLSSISPMATKLRLGSLDQTGRVVGDLSAWGTAGALFGTFITGFVLVAALPTRPIVLGVGALLVITGIAYTMAATRKAPNGTLVVVLLASLAIGSTSSSPCEFESAYFCGSVVVDEEDASVRYLVLDRLRHAAVDLDDPTNLKFRYIRLITDVIDSTTEGPIEALHLGGGGFTVPGYLEATRPGTFNHVLEIDDVLLDVARDELGFETGPNMVVTIGDGRLAFKDFADNSFDVVVGDAFGGASVPWHLTTTEFIAEIDRVLRPGGVYVMNIIDGDQNRFAEWEAATLRDNFGFVQAITDAGGVTRRILNEILIASDQPIPAIEFAPEDGILVTDIDAFIDDGQVLRDDFAPVEQLAANPSG
ncbi:MAG: SAM-dependent methyltransferase [Candidatus Aldehydirespiratoraceae bacterium]|jgi:SAM-dependent methyltransferase